MADWVKMGVKAGLIAIVTAGVLIVFTAISIPDFDLSIFSQGVGIAWALGNYYIPGWGILSGLFVSLLAFRLVIMGLSLVIITYRWIFKVNE